MLGLDTNILVRYIAQDHPAQARKVTQIIEQNLSDEHPGYVCTIVLVELCWTLRRAYGLSSAELIAVLQRLLHASDLVFEHHEEAWKALQTYRTAKADYSDILIGLIHAKQGCESTVTFDKQAAKLDHFRQA